jgi:hypothetical protein
VHVVELSGLDADTEYTFTVSGDTEQFTFNTGPAIGPDSAISFAVIGACCLVSCANFNGML